MLVEEAVGQRVAGFSFCQGRSEFVRYVHKMCGSGCFKGFKRRLDLRPTTLTLCVSHKEI